MSEIDQNNKSPQLSDSSSSASQFRGGEEFPDLEGYRPISPLVIGAAIASLASLLALAHPLLWIVPLLAVIVSLCAILRVSIEGSLYGGKGVAVIALVFATLIGGYAMARSLSRDRALYSDAKEKTEHWIALLQQGRVQEAHQLTKDTSDRFQGPGSLESHYKEKSEVPPSFDPTESDSEAEQRAMEEQMDMGESPEKALKNFVSEPVVSSILAFGTRVKVEHLQNVSTHNSFSSLIMIQRYRVTGLVEAKPTSIEFLVRATRRESGAFINWKVGECDEVE